MYSLMVVLKNEEHILLDIGSAISLSLIYQPAKKLNLPTIYSIDEENNLTNLQDFNNFKQEIKQVLEYWQRKESILECNYFPSNFLLESLKKFNSDISVINANDIEYICLF